MIRFTLVPLIKFEQKCRSSKANMKEVRTTQELLRFELSMLRRPRIDSAVNQTFLEPKISTRVQA